MDKKFWGQDLIGDEDSSSLSAEIYKEPSYVEVVNNHIYFYSHVYQTEVLQLNRKIKELDNDLLYQAKIQERDPASIFLHINSNGGSLFAGLAAMDTVLSCHVPVTTIVDGCCASAATFISIVGSERRIPKHGFMLIHQLSGVSWGKFRELQDDHENFNKLMDTIRQIYTTNTNIPPERIDEILDHDLWFDADQCLEYGLVDKII